MRRWGLTTSQLCCSWREFNGISDLKIKNDLYDRIMFVKVFSVLVLHRYPLAEHCIGGREISTIQLFNTTSVQYHSLCSFSAQVDLRKASISVQHQGFALRPSCQALRVKQFSLLKFCLITWAQTKSIRTDYKTPHDRSNYHWNCFTLKNCVGLTSDAAVSPETRLFVFIIATP